MRPTRRVLEVGAVRERARQGLGRVAVVVARGRRVRLVLDVGHVLVVEVGVALVGKARLEVAARRVGRRFEVGLGTARAAACPRGRRARCPRARRPARAGRARSPGSRSRRAPRRRSSRWSSTSSSRGRLGLVVASAPGEDDRAEDDASRRASARNLSETLLTRRKLARAAKARAQLSEPARSQT